MVLLLNVDLLLSKKYNINREFYLYDTFESMTKPESYKDVPKSLEIYNNIIYVKGDVYKTLEHNVPNKISILRLYTDWYDSTKKELDILFPIVSKN